jgi:hypothetical protein
MLCASATDSSASSSMFPWAMFAKHLKGLPKLELAIGPEQTAPARPHHSRRSRPHQVAMSAKKLFASQSQVMPALPPVAGARHLTLTPHLLNISCPASPSPTSAPPVIQPPPPPPRARAQFLLQHSHWTHSHLTPGKLFLDAARVIETPAQVGVFLWPLSSR